MADPKAQERARQRALVSKEIISTERAYVQGLEILMERYLNPLKAKCGEQSDKGETPWFSRADYDECFHSVTDTILPINRMLLSRLDALDPASASSGGSPMSASNPGGAVSAFGSFASLAGSSIAVAAHGGSHSSSSANLSQMAAAAAAQTIPAVLKLMGPRLKSYTNFVSMYDDIANKIKKIMKENPECDAFIKEREAQVKREGMLGFFSYMITPVQRIPRYQLLLRELEKNTDQDHPEWNDIQDANREMVSCAHHINDQRRNQENYRKLVQIQETYDLKEMSDEFLVGGRRFVQEADLQELTGPKNNKAVPMKAMLFSDMILLVAKNNKYSSHYKLSTVPIPWVNRGAGGASKDDHADGDSAQAHSLDPTELEVICATANLALRCSTPEEKEKWCTAIQDAIDALCETLPKMKGAAKADRDRKGPSEDEKNSEEDELDQGPQFEPVVMAVKDMESAKISFKAGDLLFIRVRSADGSVLASTGSITPGAGKPPLPLIRQDAPVRTGKVTPDFFRELEDLEKLVCEFVTRRDKRDAAKRLASEWQQQQPDPEAYAEGWAATPCVFFDQEDVPGAEPRAAPGTAEDDDDEDSRRKQNAASGLFKKLTIGKLMGGNANKGGAQ